MKLVTKLATATLFALAAAAPALASDPDALTQNERNTYLYTADARPIVEHMQEVQNVQLPAGANAFAQAVSPDAGLTTYDEPVTY